MLPGDADRVRIAVLGAVEAGTYDLAGEIVSDLPGQLPQRPDQLERLVEVLLDVVRLAEDHRPEADVVILWALWTEALALKAAGDLDGALAVLDDFETRGLSVGFDAGGRHDVELIKLGLLYATERFERLRATAETSLSRGLADRDMDAVALIEGLWLWRFGQLHVNLTEVEANVSVHDEIRRRLISDPDAGVRVAAAEGTWRALWLAVQAHDVSAVFDAVSEIDDAFAAETDEDTERLLGQMLVDSAQWLWGHSDLLPGALERSLLLSQTVLARFEQASSELDLRLLAAASWEQYKALGTLGRFEEQSVALERMIELGEVTLEVLGEQIDGRGPTEDVDPEARAYSLTLMMMRSVVLFAAIEGEEANAIALLDAAITRYRDDRADRVQHAVTAAQAVKAQMTEAMES